MSDIFYPANTNPLGYLIKHFPGLPHVLGDLTPSGLPLLYPWEDLRHQYPEIIGDAAQPTAEQVAAWVPEVVPPEDPAPVTDVEIMTGVFIDYRGQATLLLDGLKGQVWSYLKNEQKMDPAQATAAGVAFCMSEGGIGVQYGDFIKAGGHPVAATALWKRIQAVKGDFIWFDSGVEAVFATALGQA